MQAETDTFMFEAMLNQLDIPRNCFDVALVIDTLNSQQGIRAFALHRRRLAEIAENIIRFLSHDGQSAILYSLEIDHAIHYATIEEVASVFSGEHSLQAFIGQTGTDALIQAMADRYIVHPDKVRPTIVLYLTDGLSTVSLSETWIDQKLQEITHHPIFVVAVGYEDETSYGLLHTLKLAIRACNSTNKLIGASFTEIMPHNDALTPRLICSMLAGVNVWYSRLDSTKNAPGNSYSWEDINELIEAGFHNLISPVVDGIGRTSARLRNRVVGWLARQIQW